MGFSVFPGVGSIKFDLLLKHFGSAKAAWSASSADVNRVLGGALAAKFEEFKKKFSIEEYVQKLHKKHVSFITLGDKEYPELLKQTDKPPFVLYLKGTYHYDNTYYHSGTIAVVGTRRITNYGREVTEMLTSELVARGFTIVSGLAMGVDAVAHQTTINAGGKTIAVLGCGVDCVTPAENLNLYDEIIEKGGCIISELPLGHPPNKGSFPKRNRIVAGLSIGVLVTEGAEDSGALITAKFALSFGRRVFAVPGPITSQLSKAPYKLIQKGAILVTRVEDIMQELKFEVRNPLRPELGARAKLETNSKFKISKPAGSTKEEQKILEILQNEPLHFDEIVRRSGFDSSQLGSLLSLMEIKGLIKNLNSGSFSINLY